MNPFLYDQIADLLTHQITDGTLRPGDRLPSIRVLARTRGVSIATVIAAYHRLEDRGLVATRPRSGYFVRVQPEAPPPTPTTPPAEPQRPRVGNLILDVLSAVRNPAMLSLGAAYPDPHLLPTGRLARHLAAAARAADSAAATTLDPRGYAPLRQQIARRALFTGVHLDAEEVLITQGATEALALALRAVARAGDVIAVESPTYFGLLQLIDELGMRALEVTTDPRQGMCPDALEVAMERQPIRAVVVVPHFQNPLGARMPRAVKEALVSLCAQHAVPLVEDDLFGDLAFDEQRPTSLRAFDNERRILSVGSFSKTLAPGFRLGWLAPGSFLPRVERSKAAVAPAASMPAQMALARYLERGGFEAHLRALRHTFADTLAGLRHTVAESFPQGTRQSDPTGGFLLWIELPRGDAVELHRRALESGISIAPGPIFSATGQYRRCLRLNAGHRFSPRLATAVEQLGRLAQEL